MSGLDSQAVFANRMTSLGLQDLWDAFESRGWNTVGNFAFAAGTSNGGSVDDAAFNLKVLTPLFGDIEDPRGPALRRLHFECFLTMISEIQSRTTRNEDDLRPRPLPGPERAIRLSNLRAELSGLEITADLEPADTLVDKYVHMQDVTGVLKYLPFQEYGTREDELCGDKKDSFFKPDANGTFKFHQVGADSVADLATDYKFVRALMRRGVALSLARLLDFKVHERLIAWYMKELQRSPPRGHAKVSYQQVADVDKEIFLRLAEETRGGLGLDPSDGSYVLSNILPFVLLEPRIVSMLNPLLGGSSSNDPSGSKRGADPDASRLRDENKRLKTQLKSAKGRGKGKDKDKDKGRPNKADASKGTPMPTELQGLNPTVEGARTCFGFNMKKGCSEKTNSKADSMWCNKGLHACLKCGSKSGSHGASGCTR